jgi:hypothetical protein
MPRECAIRVARYLNLEGFPLIMPTGVRLALREVVGADSSPASAALPQATE